MKIYLEQNVFDAALDRIRWLYSEFDHIYVDISGGKDGTVVLNLVLRVAEELGRLPVRVLFIDQEAEWQTVVDHVRGVLSDPRIEPYWCQMPIKIFNATSPLDPWLYCWEAGKPWIREKEPTSIKENVYGTERFNQVFGAFLRVHHPDAPACHIAGVRAEESPARARGLTSYETYKGATWGKVESKARQQFTMYPLYDWSFTDVWKAIHDNGWPYCPLYDYMYQHGVDLHHMRVSNVHHETAVDTLFYLQEIEPETWDRITARLAGVNTAGQLQRQFFCPKTLPPMFDSWREYRDYLLEHLVTDEAIRARMRRQIVATEQQYHPCVHPKLIKAHIAMICANDYHGTKLSSFRAAHLRYSVNRGKISGRTA